MSDDPRTHTRREQAQHERISELVRAVDVRAPQTLHRRVREMVTERTGATPTITPPARAWGSTDGVLRGRLKPTLAAMAVAAVVGAAIALLTGGAARAPQAGGLSLSAASRLTLSAATMGAPRESSAHAAQLNVAVDGVAFPYWQERFGWRTGGMRTDTLAGRPVTTVYYRGPGGSKVGYAIVGGTPAPAVSGGTVVWRGGRAYRVLSEHGVPVVTWHRAGRLCVLSGRGVSAAKLVRLATWGEGTPA
jgi:hypothetical protein